MPSSAGWVSVRVPATSANLGPGFDSLGLALCRYDELAARFIDGDALAVEVTGEGAGEVPLDAANLVVSTIRQALSAFDETGGLAGRGLHVRCRNAIPHGRGMGSSAAAIVGAIRAAAGLAGIDDQLGAAELIALATRIEGHPDNVAAAVLGGGTIAWLAQGGDSVGPVGRAVRFEVCPEVVPVLVIPSNSAGTSRARAALPMSVPHADAAFNAARSALLVHALGSDPALLLEATDDRLHQQQRRAVYPQSIGLVQRLRELAIPAAISGAGPTVVAFATDGSGAELVRRIREVGLMAGEVVATAVSGRGVQRL